MVSSQERIPVDLLENGKEWGEAGTNRSSVVGSRRGVRWPCTEGGGGTWGPAERGRG